MKELAIVTGCDSGIGKGLCEAYLREGFEVLASFLEPSTVADRPGLFKEKMDFEVPPEIDSFVRRAKNLVGEGRRIAFLVLNAGTSAVGAVEDLDPEILRKVFEVNFFGNFSLIQALLPLVRQDVARICLVSSAAGKIALPFFSPYVCSKFALEGLGDCVRRELSPFGVKTIIFEPRAVSTPIWRRTWDNAEKTVLPEMKEIYRRRMIRGAGRLIAGAEKGMNSDAAAKFIVRMSRRSNPAPRYIVSRRAFLAALQFRIPVRLADRIIERIFS